MLTFTMVWAYFSFSQWLIIWAGNLPEEITWYLDRIHGGWQTVALSLVLLQFSLPFLLLLSRELKRDARKLVPVALLVLVMRYVDLYWLVAPNPFPGTGVDAHHLTYHWTYFAAPLALVSLWLGMLLLATRQASSAGGHRTDAAASLGAKPWPLITDTETATERNPSVEFDKSDLSARGILIFFFVLAVFAVVINLVVLGLYVGMTKIAEKHETGDESAGAADGYAARRNPDEHGERQHSAVSRAAPAAPRRTDTAGDDDQVSGAGVGGADGPAMAGCARQRASAD